MKPVLEREINGGVQKLFRFDNNYGASVVRHCHSYGHEDGLWELAVIVYTRKEDNEQFVITYATHITGDVRGFLTWEEVEDILGEIQTL